MRALKVKMDLVNYSNMQKAIVEKSKYEQCEGCFLQNYCSGCHQQTIY